MVKNNEKGWMRGDQALETGKGKKGRVRSESEKETTREKKAL